MSWLVLALLARTSLVEVAPSYAPQGPSYTPQEANALFAEANDAYYKGDYAQAKEKYGRLLDAGLSGPDVLFNLGTTHLAAGELGPAVLFLERARRLANDDDIEANLNVARQRQLEEVENPVSEEPFLQRLAAAVDERAVSLAFLGAWYLAFLLLAWFRLRLPGTRTAVGLAAAAAFAVALATGSVVGVHAWVAQSVKEAVVQADTAQVRDFPGPSARVAFEVHQGLKVRVMEESGKFVRIRLPNAVEGWTEKEGVTAL